MKRTWRAKRPFQRPSEGLAHLPKTWLTCTHLLEMARPGIEPGTPRFSEGSENPWDRHLRSICRGFHGILVPSAVPVPIEVAFSSAPVGQVSDQPHIRSDW